MSSYALKSEPELTRKSVAVAVAATAGLLTSSPSVIFATFGLFLAPVSHAFGIGRGPFGAMIGVSMLIGALLTPFAGQAMDRFGVRRLVLPGILALGVIELLLSVVPASAPLLAGLIVLQGLAACLVTPLAYTKVLSLWFNRRRGIMLGIAAAVGIGAGAGVSAALVGTLMAFGGWRLGYAGVGLYVLLVGGAVVAPWLREPPAVERSLDAAAQPPLPGLSRREAMGQPPFWLILLFIVASLGGIAIMTAHGPALLSGRGLHIGPVFLACVAFGSLFGQIASGYLLDRIDTPKVGLGFALATLAGAVVILYFGYTAEVVLPAAVVMGLGQGAETGLAPYYTSRFCGLKAYTGISGVLLAGAMLSAGISAALVGFIFDKTGSYAAAMPVVDGLLALAAAAIVFMPRYRYAAGASPGKTALHDEIETPLIVSTPAL